MKIRDEVLEKLEKYSQITNEVFQGKFSKQEQLLVCSILSGEFSKKLKKDKNGNQEYVIVYSHSCFRELNGHKLCEGCPPSS